VFPERVNSEERHDTLQAFNVNHPGTWTVTSDAPEFATSLMIVTGLIWMAFMAPVEEKTRTKMVDPSHRIDQE
jgi:hypothetical protein